jgi:hypothetical protein
MAEHRRRGASMDVGERIVQRLDELLGEARSMVSAEDLVDGTAWDAWRVSAQPLVAQISGRKSEYYTRFAERATWGASAGLFSPKTATAILGRLRDDYAKGYLRDVRELAAAEVFTDFLDMAEHFLSPGYHPAAAASVAGAVVEDFLRRLHGKRIAEWQGDSSITKLNDALRKANVYGVEVWRQIQAWGDIRNHADHGRFEGVDAASVKLVIQGVRDFIAKHEG